jgi:hypothetical protein
MWEWLHHGFVDGPTLEICRQIYRQTGLELCRSKVWWSWECDGQTGLSLRGIGGHDTSVSEK